MQWCHAADVVHEVLRETSALAIDGNEIDTFPRKIITSAKLDGASNRSTLGLEVGQVSDPSNLENC